MSVIAEKTILSLLQNCLQLSVQALELVRDQRASDAAPEALVAGYGALIQALQQEKRHDTVLADQSWEWIWKIQPGITPIQIYGRLAWINYNLIDLL